MISLKQCSKFFLTCVFGLTLAVPALAEEVKTDAFSIDLPAAWKQPQPVQSMNGATMTIFQNTKDESVVSITVVASPVPAKDVAAKTIERLKSDGINVSDPVEKDGVYKVSHDQQSQGKKGVSYFVSNGKTFTVTTILGSTLDTGKELLKGLKPVDPSLFPKF